MPEHLRGPIIDWLASVVDRFGGGRLMVRRAALRASVAWDETALVLPTSIAAALVRGGLAGGEDQLLNLLDAILYEVTQSQQQGPGNQPASRHSAVGLEMVLSLGGSAWRVSERGDRLEQRVDEAVATAYTHTADQGRGSAGNHLREAWTAIYGRPPNPTHAYAEAIRAVEAAAAPIVTPNDLKATLGTIRGEMQANHTRFTFAISPADPGVVIDMVSTLWDGQTGRHGGNMPTVEVTPEAAEAAVHLAATLVHLFSSGGIVRRT